VAYADVLALVIIYLDGLHTVPVASRVPDPRPAEWIQVRHVGGTQLRPVRDVVRLDVFYWDNDGDAAAMTGGQTVRGQIHALAGTSTLGVVCYRVDETLGPRPNDDPLTGAPRSWATYALRVRANDAIHASA